jgi:sulfatase maturation enzyme AslB (radical SAM superfamily)
MKIQSLSVEIPRKKRCINDCPFCVSKMREDEYYNHIEDTQSERRSIYHQEFRNRLQFARDNGCNTMILTGQGEPIQNMKFIDELFEMNASIRNPFLWIELQTTGVMLDDEKLEYFKRKGVSTIALSVADIFNDLSNNKIIGTPPKGYIELNDLCKRIKKFHFNLRLSINMIRIYDYVTAENIFDRLKDLGADQVIFREFYEEGNGGSEDEWIRENKALDRTLLMVQEYIESNGRKLERLPFGATRYSLDGISTVLDRNCMVQNEVKSEDEDPIRYLILRPNVKLYSRWNDKGSLIF